MVKILRYIFILLLISPIAGFGQKKKEVWRYEGPRFGIDVSRFLMPYIQKTTRSGIEIQADIPYNGNWFPTIEAGYLDVNDDNDKYHYTNKGPYGRIGIDLNIVKFESLSDNDLVIVGVRYGFSHFTQETLMAKSSNYWGTTSSSFPQNPMNAHWGELLFGMKGELLPNIFFGWSVRAKFLFAMTKDPHVTPFVVPGLGYINSEVPVDFSLTVAYRIPLKRTKTMPKALQMGGAKQSDSDLDDPNNPDNNMNNRNNRNSNNFNSGRQGGNQY
ncbi:MAG: DUF6048 family protein [Prolixibacteraceae bacterium]